MLSEIDFILVPAGNEYQAVFRGLAKALQPKIIPIPIGYQACLSSLKNLPDTAKVLLMGLGGSLSPDYAIGDVVIYQDCRYIPLKTNLLTPLPPSPHKGEGEYHQDIKQTDHKLTHLLIDKLALKTRQITGLTSDRLISSATEKIALGKKYDAQVVDMEAFAILEKFAQVAIIRVISDDCKGDLPDISGAITEEGKLKPLSLAYGMLRNPYGALLLIQGSLKSLKILTEVAEGLM